MSGGSLAHPAELVGLGDIAARAGIVPSAVSNWRKRFADFPEPWGTFSCGPLWLWSEVETWIKEGGKNRAENLRHARAYHEQRIAEIDASLARAEETTPMSAEDRGGAFRCDPDDTDRRTP